MEQKEKKISSASYLLNFYLTIENLNAFVAQYSNLILFLGQKYKGLEANDFSKMEQKDKEQLVTTNENTRSLIVQAFIKFDSLKETLKPFKAAEKKVNDLYVKIDNNFFSDRADYLEFAKLLNKLFSDSVIHEVLENQQDIYKDFMTQSGGGSASEWTYFEWECLKNKV